VHLEFKMSASSLYDFDAERGDQRLSVDLVVSNLGDFVEGEDSHRRFGSKRHEVFVEAKYLYKGLWGNSTKNALEGVARDAANQHQRLQGGRCQVAALFVVDDENAFEKSNVPIPGELVLLVASPLELQRRGITVPGTS
jgi:hypothetical protein